MKNKIKIKIISNGIIFCDEGNGLIIDYPNNYKAFVQGWILIGNRNGFRLHRKTITDINRNQSQQGNLIDKLKFMLVKFMYRRYFKGRKKSPSKIIIEPINKKKS